MTDISAPDDHQRTRPGEVWEAQLLTGVSVTAEKPLTHGEAREANQAVHDVVGKLAALTVRRQCNQHACTLPSTGACEHENARRDADYLRHVLDVLGLPQDFQQVTEADRAGLLDAMAQKQAIGVDRYETIIED
jgi:hypothetical protein